MENLDGSVTVYKIMFTGTETRMAWGEEGEPPYTFDEVYADRADAERRCADLNGDVDEMMHDARVPEEFGPFSDFSGANLKQMYSRIVRLPWPQLWDKCKDLGIRPPLYDEEDEDGEHQECPGDEPDIEELQNWWVDSVALVSRLRLDESTGAYINPVDNPRYGELRDELMKYMNLPVLYAVTEETISAAQRAEMQKAFAKVGGWVEKLDALAAETRPEADWEPCGWDAETFALHAEGFVDATGLRDLFEKYLRVCAAEQLRSD